MRGKLHVWSISAHEAAGDHFSHIRVMHACAGRLRGHARCIVARYGGYAACRCMHAGGAHMPSSNHVIFRACKARLVKWGLAGPSLRIWLKVLRINAWLIPCHRIISHNSRKGCGGRRGSGHGGGMFVSNKTNVQKKRPTECSSCFNIQ